MEVKRSLPSPTIPTKTSNHPNLSCDEVGMIWRSPTRQYLRRHERGAEAGVSSTAIVAAGGVGWQRRQEELAASPSV